MEQELQLWDDTRSQVIQFYLAKTFRRGNQHKTKLLYHFRIGQINPETKSLKPVMEVLNRESHLEDWDNLSRRIRDIILARSEDAQFMPREKDIELSFERILATPQIETKLNIDGVAYLAQTPEITGHMGIEVKFWTTVELLKKFQMQLHQILQNREFRTNVEILPDVPVSGLTDDEEEPEEAEETKEESEELDASDVVKKAQPNTEMMMKVEDSIDGDDDESVEVEDWEAEDVEELGGDDDLDNGKDDKDEKTDEPVKEEVKQEETEPEKPAEDKKIEEPEKAEKSEEKPETNKTEEEEKTEEKEEEKPKPKRRGRKPKAEKKDDEADDKKEDKPKKTTKAKTTAKKTTAKKTPGRKPRKTKKDDEKKEEVKEEKPAEKAEEKKDE